MKIEMSKGDINKIICFSALIAGITMLVIGTKRKNTAKIAIKKIDDAVKDVANKTVTDISDEIMHKAAENAAERAAEKAVEKVRSDISNKVACAISEIYDTVENDVKERLSKATEKDIDMDSLKKSIETDVSAIVAAKVMNNIEDFVGPLASCISRACSMKGENNENRH